MVYDEEPIKSVLKLFYLNGMRISKKIYRFFLSWYKI